MKRHVVTIIISLILFYVPTSSYAQDNSAFRLLSDTPSSSIILDKTIKKDSVINFGGLRENVGSIEGLDVSMDVVPISSDYLVRVILQDQNGNKHLVAESYNQLHSNRSVVHFIDYCEETALLNAVIPHNLIFVIKNAEVRLRSISFPSANPNNTNPPSQTRYTKVYNEFKERQESEKANLINEYNRAHNKLWHAGITGMSLLPYERKMQLLGCSDSQQTFGLEYYTGGIIDIDVLGENNNHPAMGEMATTSLYINKFDWRDRHGMNWITPVKDQGASGYCSAFSAISCVEAAVNLWLNDTINLDLSEQEAASCNSYTSGSNRNFYILGMPIISPLEYIRDNGVCDDASYPFVDDPLARFCHSDTIVPDIIVTVDSISSDLKTPENTNVDRIKHALIHYGPLSSGIYVQGGTKHSMALVGYGVVEPGDIVQWIWNYNEGHVGLTDTLHIDENHPLVGRNYWIFKNSYINGETCNPPYMLVAMDWNSSINNTYAVFRPTVRIRNAQGSYVIENDVAIRDNDGDGYYTWGLGPKPDSCPSWIPDEPDGNDDDYTMGPMDNYGYLYNIPEHINDTIYIDCDTVWSSQQFLYSHVVVRNHAILTISSDVEFYDEVEMIIRDNAILYISGGHLTNAIIKSVVNSGSNIIIDDGGIIEKRLSNDFEIPLGTSLQIDEGIIQ